MANPQKEEGYTPIANEIMDALCRYRIPGEERQILDFVFRKTYGWNKPKDQISLSQFSCNTGLSRRNVARAIKSLVSKMILGSVKGDTTKITTYYIIKDYEKWKHSVKSDTSVKNDTRASVNIVQRVVSKVIPTKDNTTKDNIKTTTAEGLKTPSQAALKHKKGQVAYDMFRAKYKEVVGTEYIAQWGKDLKLFNPVLPHIKSSDHWGRVLDAYFKDSFAQTTKFTFGVLISQINRYNKEAQNENI